MYTSYFRLHEKPFDITPDPRFLYLSENHQEALAHLMYAVKERKGFIVLTGDVGTGKTTLLNTLLNQIHDEVKQAYIYNPNLDIKEFYQFIANAFNLTFNGNKTAFLIQLDAFLKQCLSDRINVLLIIDEAQNLKPSLLEEIRLLSNLETQQYKLIQIFLAGQEQLNYKLNLDSLRQLRQRVSVRYDIKSLTFHETGEYIKHRLKVAGFTDKELFNTHAVKTIYSFSTGIPRVINILCDYSLVIAYSRDKRIIDDTIIKEAARDLALSKKPQILSHELSSPHKPAVVTRSMNGIPNYIGYSLLFIVVCILGSLFYLEESLEWTSLKKSFASTGIKTFRKISYDFLDSNSYPSIAYNSSNQLLHSALSKNDSPPSPVIKTADPKQEGNNAVPGAQDQTISVTTTISPSTEKMPYNTAKDFNHNEAQVQFITAKKDDSISALAIKQYGILNEMVLKLIKENNPEIKDLNSIKIGQIIKFPPLNQQIAKKEILYGVHIASYLIFKDAIEAHQAWLEKGYEANLVPVMLSDNRKWYRVILGAFNNKTEGRLFAKTLLDEQSVEYAEVIPIYFDKITAIEERSMKNNQ